MEDLEQLRLFIAAATSAATAGSSGPGTVGHDLSELRSIVDTRVMEKSLSLTVTRHTLQSGGSLSRQRVGSWVWKKF